MISTYGTANVFFRNVINNQYLLFLLLIKNLTEILSALEKIYYDF